MSTADDPLVMKPVPGYEGLYQVSRDGLVVGPKGIRKSFPDKRGRHFVSLCQSGEQKMFAVHRLVLMAFVGPCPDGMECAHLNGNPSDNRLENLAWMTHRENESHKIIHGTINRGHRNGQARLTREQVISIRTRRSAGETFAAIGEDFGIAESQIWQIVKGQSWANVPEGLANG